ncbi:SRPBCC family protein [Flagellimonas sp.]|uniref:SRPBCC family protein n=1 Tax=Flagellimonas sp. TaxID=2058762 RepID=UPI003B59EF19
MITNSLYLERTFDCSIEELFRWFSKANLIAQWFGPKHLNIGNISVNFQINGAYRIELKKENGDSFYITGIYQEILAPEKIVFNLTYDGLLKPPPDSVVKILLEQVTPSSTKLTFVQKFEILPPDMENRTKAWEFMFSKLNPLLKSEPRP